MGLLDSLFSGDTSQRATVRAQAKKIDELEDVVKDLSSEVKALQKKLEELTDVASYLSVSQQQLASDMGIIYENVKAIGDVLTSHAAAEEDEKYFSWRWNINDDDDDLPN